MVAIRAYYDPPVKVQVLCTKEEDKTLQSEYKGTDINVIVKQYQKTGILPQMRQGQFLDVSIASDYREAMAQVAEADAFFARLPADIRSRFDNDPAVFLDFAANASNREDLEKMGLVSPEPEAPDGSATPEAQPPA